MSSFKLKKCGGECLLINQLHSFLLLWLVLLAAPSAEAQSYVLKEVVIKGGGFVTGIVTHPNVPGVMYCRTDVGGNYRWNPANNSWVPLQDFIGPTNSEFGLFGGESIALDPQDANRLYMTCGWLGAGRPNEIWISTNQGATFTRVTAPFTLLANSDGRSNGERLAVDPNLGSILFNGTRLDGLWKSVNYAASWSKVTSFPVNTTTNQVGLVFVEFIKSSGGNGSATPEIWVGVSQGGNNLYRSTDGGASWSAVPSGAPAGYMPHRASQDGLGNMYVTFNDAAGPNDVGAGAVRKINLATLATTNVTPPTSQGGFGGVSVDKQNPTTLVVCTMGRWYPHDEVYRSTNGGTTWNACYGSTPVIDGSSAPWVNLDQATPPVPTWIGDIKIDPFNSDRVYHISGGGVWSSYNLTATSPTWQFRSDGIEEMGLWGGGGALCSPPSGPLFYCAFGDIGGFADYNPDVSPPKTDHFFPFYGSNTSVDFAEQNPAIVVRTHYGTKSDGTSATGGGRSTDSGKTWTEFPTHPSAADNDPGVIAISADGTRLVWVSQGSPAFYSTNNGATWTQCGGNITPTYSWEMPLLCSDRVNRNKFYLYITSTGVVNVSTDGGATFVAGATVSPGAPNTINVDKAMRTVYGQEGNIWISCIDYDTNRAGLWRSTNSGVSFTKVSGVQNAQAIGFGRTASGSGYPVLYLSGQVNNVWGIYRSEDTAASWIRLNDDQHQYGIVSQITGDPKIYGRCYFNGRGLLYGDIYTPPQVTKMIYQDSLVDGWQNWSWATTNTASAAPVRRGTSAISVTAGGYEALFLRRPAEQSTVGYSAVAFWIHGGQSGGQPLQVASLRSGNTQVFKPIPPPLAGQWTRVVIPLSELGLTNVWDFDGLWIQNSSGSAISTFYVDDIALVGEADAGAGAPSAPGELATTAGNAQVALTWNASSGATDYNVKRATVSGGPYTTVTTVTGTSFTNTGLTNGTTYYYVVAALNTYGESTNSSQLAATPLTQGPYGGTPWPVPGVIEAENYDIGGQDFAYNDSDTANQGGQYRSDGVDVETCAEGGYNVGWTATGEWLEYTVNVAYTGSYRITLRAASLSPQIQGHVEFDGVNVTGLMTASATGGWQTYTDVTVPDVTLTAGPHVMRVFYDGGGWNLNRVTLTANPLAAPQNLTATPGSKKITLSWNAVSGANDYTIQRSSSSGGSITSLASGVTATSYIDSGLADGASWYYTIAANGPSGLGSASSPVSATTYTAVENWRLTNFGTIANTGNAADTANPDGDDQANAQEYVAGTNPNSGSSVLKIGQMQTNGNNMVLSFASVSGKTYRVERSDTLQNGSWVTVQDNIAGNGSVILITDTGGAAQPKRFYRVAVSM
ncbi:MAG: carbohydrate-binding protein [Chthoniobacterales bacterium]